MVGAQIFQTPVTPDVLDPAAFQAYADGQEQPVRGGFGDEDKPSADGPKHVTWTAGSAPEWNGAFYGVSKNLGVRYLRIGFQTALTRRDGAGAWRRHPQRPEGDGGLSGPSKRGRGLDPGAAYQSGRGLHG